MLILLPVFLFLCLYGALLLFYRRGWNRLPSFSAPADFVPSKTVSVLIPVRNEAANIARLLTCIQQQNYPRHLLQVIVIDDQSTDNTREIAATFSGVEVIVLDNNVTFAHKKRAIEAGIAAARGEWIVTTDGDCYMGPDWLRCMMAFQQKTNALYMAAPVVIDAGPTLVQKFQQMDFAVLQGVTGVSVSERLHAMSNGANQAYTRSIFAQVNGYAGVDNIASGDDMLLLQKINDLHPDGVVYLRSGEAIVYTAPVSNWRAFFQQRIRWASKARYYTEKKIWLVMLTVYGVNLGFLLLLVGGIFDYRLLMAAFVLLLCKTCVEWPFVHRVFRFFNLRFHFARYLLLQPLHIIYTVSSGFLGLIGKYEWKGRKAN